MFLFQSYSRLFMREVQFWCLETRDKALFTSEFSFNRAIDIIRVFIFEYQRHLSLVPPIVEYYDILLRDIIIYKLNINF